MANEVQKIGGAIVVLRGSFNPAIIHPAWLAMHGVVDEEDTSEAIVRIVTPDLSVFTVAGLAVEVLREEMTFSTTAETEAWSTLPVFAVSILSLLAHTPIAAVGLNRVEHRAIREGGWESLAERFAPNKVWTEVVEEPMLQVLRITGGSQSGPSRRNIALEPSLSIEGGVFVNINDHFDLTDDDGTYQGAEPAIAIIQEYWDKSLAANERILNWLIEAT